MKSLNINVSKHIYAYISVDITEKERQLHQALLHVEATGRARQKHKSGYSRLRNSTYSTVGKFVCFQIFHKVKKKPLKPKHKLMGNVAISQGRPQTGFFGGV